MTEEFLICPVCGKHMQFIDANHIKNHGYSTKLFKEKFNIKNLKIDKIRKRQSKFMKENNPTKGRKRTDEEKSLMSKNRAGKGVGRTGKYLRTKEIREKISLGVSKAHIEGRLPKFSIKNPDFGDYIYSEKMNMYMWCDSPYEERLVILLDAMPEIVSFKREPLRIKYSYDGITRNYIPDFYVQSEGPVHWLWEFKVEEELQTVKGKAKKSALEDYCHSHGYNSYWIDKKELKRMEDLNWWRIKDDMEVYLKWR